MNTLQGKSRRHLLVLGVVVVLMFGFSFALVPLYEVFCKVTGINGKIVNQATANHSQVDLSRTITIQFAAQTSPGMPWEFRPMDKELKIHPGQMYDTQFYVRNQAPEKIVGQAVPSISPGQASLYMQKLECFCFRQQMLEPKADLVMPVRFYIDPALPKDVKTMTLSYTLYNVTDRIQTTQIP